MSGSQRWNTSPFAVAGTMSMLFVAPALAHGPSQRPDPRPGQGPLRIEFDRAGLSALSYRSLPLLRSGKGALGLVDGSPVLRKPGGTVEIGNGRANAERFDAARKTLIRSYAWGTVRARYEPHDDRLAIRLSVVNTSRANTIDRLELRLAELAFPGVPQGGVLDAGQFALDKPYPLSEHPLFAPSEAMPPIVDVRYGRGTLLLCGDDPAAPVTVGVAAPSDRPTNLTYPMVASFGAIAPGRSVEAAVSLRFGEAGAPAKTLAGDVLERYAKRYPYRLAWRDRRPIGGLVLASVGKHAPGNPRGWFNDVPDVDVTTPAGLARFRTRLLAYASIRELRAANAQGMITWDVEGEAIDSVCYNGDPRLAEKVAPETEYRGEGKLACLDEYFRKFRDAGFRVGVCLRPQQIRFVAGVPRQEDVADPEAVLKAKIAYARRRWGCTLFYLDSTVDHKLRALPADVFEHLADANPDVLLVPENEVLRDYAYSAPLNSFQHHTVTATPPGARMVYPQAFSVLFAMEGDFAHHFDELVASVRRGDILLFRAWWADPSNPTVKRIYDAAAQR